MKMTNNITNILIVVILTCIQLNFGLEYKEIVNKTLGHKRYSNGEIKWGHVPERKYHGNTDNAGTGVWTTTVNFAKSVIFTGKDAKSFPYDLIRRILRNEYTQKEIDDYETNIIVSCSVGGVIICIIIGSFLAYFFYKRWKQRKALYQGQKPFLIGNNLNIVLVLGIVVTVINLIFVICIMVVNSKIGTGIKRMTERVDDAMDDVTSYFDQTRKQYDYMREDTNTWFGRDVLTEDIRSVGSLIWQPGHSLFYPSVSKIFQKLDNVDDYMSVVEKSLQIMVEVISEVNQGIGPKLKAKLSAAYYNLTFATSDWTCIGCKGSCNGCREIVADDIFPRVDFSTLPDLNNSLLSLKRLTETPFKSSHHNPHNFFTHGIGEVIQGKLAENISNIQRRVDEFIVTVRNSTQAMIFPTRKSFYFNELSRHYQNFHSRLDKGNNIRSGFTVFFSVVNILFIVAVVVLAVYLLIKKCSHRRTLIVEQDDQYVLHRRLLFGGAITGITLSVCYLSLAITGFYIGANMERVFCQSSENYGIIEKVIDVPDTVPGHPGYFMGSIVLGNGSHELKLSDVLRKCEKNRAAFTTLRQYLTSPNLINDLNISTHFGGIDDVFDDMYTDLVNVSLVPPTLPEWIENITKDVTFDTEPFEKIFNASVTSEDLSSFVANLRHVANTPQANGGPMDPAKSKLIEVANHLTSWINEVTELTNQKNKLEGLYNKFHESVMFIENSTADVIFKLREINPDFWNRSSDYLKQGLDMFRADFMKVLPKFSIIDQKWVNDKIGTCEPLTKAYDSVVYGFCDSVADYENAEWMLCGLTSMFIIILTVIIIIIQNSLIADTTRHDDVGKKFERMFSTSKQSEEGVVEKALVRAKSPLSKLSVRGRSYNVSPLPVGNN